MKTIYLVFGATGEYSDYTTWFVRAFLNKSEAEQHVRLAASRAVELFSLYEKDSLISRWEFRENNVNEFDPKWQMDYNGTRYHMEEGTLYE